MLRRAFGVYLLLAVPVAGCSKGGQKDEAKDEKVTIEIKNGQIKGAEKVKGFYEVSGSKISGTSGSSVSESGIKQDNSPVEIEWPFTKAEFEKLKEGMTLEEGRKALGLSVLKFNPRGPESELRLVCKHGAARMTLVFSGMPELKLASKSAQGLK